MKDDTNKHSFLKVWSGLIFTIALGIFTIFGMYYENVRQDSSNFNTECNSLSKMRFTEVPIAELMETCLDYSDKARKVALSGFIVIPIDYYAKCVSSNFTRPNKTQSAILNECLNLYKKVNE